jgi:uncharacterized membrane protein
MDWVQIHIIIDHFPAVLMVTGALAALLGVVRPRRGVWLYAAVSLTLGGMTAVPTYFTGGPAEKALHDPWYMAKEAIHVHEQAAKISGLLAVLAALVAVVVWRRLVRYPREVRIPGWLRAGLVITALAAAAAIGYTSLLGGRIVHGARALRGPPPTAGPTQSVPARSVPAQSPPVAPLGSPPPARDSASPSGALPSKTF